MKICASNLEAYIYIYKIAHPKREIMRCMHNAFQQLFIAPLVNCNAIKQKRMTLKQKRMLFTFTLVMPSINLEREQFFNLDQRN